MCSSWRKRRENTKIIWLSWVVVIVLHIYSQCSVLLISAVLKMWMSESQNFALLCTHVCMLCENIVVVLIYQQETAPSPLRRLLYLFTFIVQFSSVRGGIFLLFFIVQFSSVQWGICVLGKAPKRSAVSPTLPLKQLQRLSDWWWPSLVLSRSIIKRFLCPCLSPPGSGWCGVLGLLSAVLSPSSGPLFPALLRHTELSSCPVSDTAVAGCADRWPSAKLPLLSQCVKQLLFHKGTPACLWKTGPGTKMDEPQLYWAVFRKLESAVVILY